jgi:hypothetical protein
MGDAMGKVFRKALGLLIGMAMLAYGVVDWVHTLNLQKHGAVAIAEPISGYSRSGKQGGIYTADFTFYDRHQWKISKRTAFPKEILQDFEKHSPVHLFYDPDNPNDFVFERSGPEWAALLLGLLIIAGSMGGAFD